MRYCQKTAVKKFEILCLILSISRVLEKIRKDDKYESCREESPLKIKYTCSARILAQTQVIVKMSKLSLRLIKLDAVNILIQWITRRDSVALFAIEVSGCCISIQLDFVTVLGVAYFKKT